MAKVRKGYDAQDRVIAQFKRDVKRGLATLCIGGGMGIAMCIER